MSKIIGQDKLIKEVNRIFQVFVNSNCKIRPHFILTGESGSGKSFTIKQLCDMNELSFLEVNAAQITKEGISGWEVYCYRPGLNRGGKRGMLRDCL